MASSSLVSPKLSLSSRLGKQETIHPRQRPIRACQACRARRIKCDNKRPICSACAKSGIDCVKNHVDNGPLLDPGSLKILQRIGELENVVKSILQPPATLLSAASASQTSQSNKQRLTTEELLSWSIFLGQYDSHRDLKALLRRSPNSQATRSPTLTDFSSFMSSEAESVSPRKLLARFFCFVHVKNPMLDEANVRQIVHRLSLEGPAWDTTSCLALLVCAIGSIASSFNASDDTELDGQCIAVGESFFNAAQRRIGIISGSGGVLEAQCHFYSGVYLMTRLQPLRAWRYFTQGLACCQEFTCANPVYHNQSNESGHGLASVALPAEESVYWSCWKSERELRVYLDLPDFAFNELSYPVLFPTPPESMAEEQAISWYFYLAEISLIRLEHRVRNEIKNVLAHDGPSLLEDLANCTRTTEQLADEWVQSLPPAMNLFTAQDEDDVLKFILRGHLLNLWEIIYWPWLEFFLNKRLCRPEITPYVAKGLQIGIDRIRVNKPGFRHRHHGTWLMIQSCTRSALMLLAAKRTTDGTGLMPDGWQEAVSDAMDLLRFWHQDTYDAADRLVILDELSANLSL